MSHPENVILTNMCMIYDANGNAAQTQLVDSNHKGTFDASDAGYTWVDNGTAIVFVPWIGY